MKSIVVAQQVEYLGVACEQKTTDKTGLAVISVRMNPTQSFAPINIALTKEQIFRLMSELDTIIQNNECLQLSDQEEDNLADQLTDAFEAIDNNHVRVSNGN